MKFRTRTEEVTFVVQELDMPVVVFSNSLGRSVNIQGAFTVLNRLVTTINITAILACDK